MAQLSHSLEFLHPITKVPVPVLATPLPNQIPVNVPRRQQMMARVPEFLQPMEETQMESLASAFHLVRSQLL